MLSRQSGLDDGDALPRRGVNDVAVASSAAQESTRVSRTATSESCKRFCTPSWPIGLRDDAWPALDGALAKTEQLGAQPADVLRSAADKRELASARASRMS